MLCFLPLFIRFRIPEIVNDPITVLSGYDIYSQLLLIHKWILSLDFDSFYFSHEDMGMIGIGLGNNYFVELDSLFVRLHSTDRSRFGIVNEIADHHLVANGLTSKKVKIAKFPNICIARCNVNGFDKPIYIHLFYLGVSKLRKTNYFTDDELMVITTLMNLARWKVKGTNSSDGTSFGLTQEFHKLKLFECLTGKLNHQWMRNCTSKLSHTNFVAFGTAFDEQLDFYGNHERCDRETFDRVFGEPSFNGARSVRLGGKKPNLLKMYNFVKDLRKSVYFSASMAGCKHMFKDDPDFYVEKVFGDKDEINSHIGTMKKKAQKMFLETLFRPEVRNGSPISSSRMCGMSCQDLTFHFDVGVEIVPTKGSQMSFVLNGKEAKEMCKNMIMEMKRTTTMNTRSSLAVETETEIDDIDDNEERNEETRNDNTGNAPTANPHVMTGDIEIEEDQQHLLASDHHSSDINDRSEEVSGSVNVVGVDDRDENRGTDTTDDDDDDGDPDYIDNHYVVTEQDLVKKSVAIYPELHSNGYIGSCHSGNILQQLKSNSENFKLPAWNKSSGDAQSRQRDPVLMVHIGFFVCTSTLVL